MTRMKNIILFNPSIHRDDFRSLCIDSMQWHADELLENYGKDIVTLLGVTATDIVDQGFDSFLDIIPEQGVIYMVSVDKNIVGMLALSKIRENTGELHRMWISPEYRGKGYSKPIIYKVLEEGKRLGFSKILLSTPKFAHAAQHLYKVYGFKEIEEYPETEVPLGLRQYWLYMEKRE